MSIEIFVKYKGNRTLATDKLKDYIFTYKDEYNDLTLKFCGKWIWCYITEDENYSYFTIEFSKEITKEERKKFTGIIIDLGFETNDDG